LHSFVGLHNPYVKTLAEDEGINDFDELRIRRAVLALHYDGAIAKRPCWSRGERLERGEREPLLRKNNQRTRQHAKADWTRCRQQVVQLVHL